MKQRKDNFQVVGLMSGTSLDGLDIVYVSFSKKESITFELITCETLAYTQEWKQKLSEAFHTNPKELEQLDIEFGSFLGTSVKSFIQKNNLHPDLIASHGHTVFHRPDEGYTLQIGSGKKIREISGIPVIYNFRAQDVSLGGQGAPLVPIGDEHLFSEYDFCLNLGGFSNISWKQDDQRRACDIGVCNILFNEICKRIPIDFDRDGQLAKQGNIIIQLLDKWNALPFYKQYAPKSLGREWFEQHFLKDISEEIYDTNDLLATALHHMAFQIHQFINSQIESLNESMKTTFQILATGGGAHNAYLLKVLQTLGGTKIQYSIPDKKIVDYKEAIVFALLGYLRCFDDINVLASVTGAKEDHSSGEIVK